MITMRRTFALLLACALAFGPGAVFAAAPAPSGTDGLRSLLSAVPISAFLDGWLSYADLEVLSRFLSADGWPQSIPDYVRISEPDRKDSLLRVMKAVGAGSSDYLRLVLNPQNLQETSGLDFFKTPRIAQTGTPPKQLLWLQGSLDRDQVGEALAGRGYEPLAGEGGSFEVWAGEGDLQSGSRLNLKNRDPDFPFGGMLGQSWPVLIREDLLVSGPDAERFDDILGPEVPRMADAPEIQGLLELLPSFASPQPGAVGQLILVPAPADGLLPIDPLSPYSLEDYQTLFMGNPIPPSPFLALAHVLSPTEQQVVAALSYDSRETAQAALQSVARRLEGAKLIRTEVLLTELVQSMDGSVEGPRIAETPGGFFLVLVSFRFPLNPQTSGSSPSSAGNRLPFVLFSGFLQTEDMAWMMP